MCQYSTNLTDKQWQIIEKIINPQERKRKHQLRNIMNTIHSLVRKMTGWEESPSMGIIDSCSVKTSHHVDSDRGINGNKRVKGRKEHIVVDTLGIPMALAIHEAGLHDNKGALKVIG